MTVKNIRKPEPYVFPYKRIRVFPDRDLRASILELAMIDTRIVQRLRQTKQLGNSNISYPTAEHSRFSHSLGVLYWVSKILTALKENHNREINITLLDKLNQSVKNHFKLKITDIDATVFNDDSFLGVSWFEQLARLYGLLHDLTHIPFGHTIEDQAGLFARHDDDLTRLNHVFGMLKAEIKSSYHFKDVKFAEIISKIADEYVSLIKLMFVVGFVADEHETDDKTQEPWLDEWNQIPEDIKGALMLTYDIVSNTICADLMDYTLRDSLFAGMPKTFDKALLTSMQIVYYDSTFYEPGKKQKSMPRLGVNISHKKIRHDVITAILDLLRIRYDLTEKVYYHHTKVIMDAMMEKILRSLPIENRFKPQEIYDNYLGDEGFLNLLESKVKDVTNLDLEGILQKMFKRNLYKVAFRINDGGHHSRIGKKALNRCKKSLDRTEVEKEIIEEIKEKYGTSLDHGDIIISNPHNKMQKKVAKALIEWTDGQIFTFENLPKEANYSNEVGVLTDRYHSLWAMTILLNPEKVQYIRLVESICESKFDVQNDSILKNYLKLKYKPIYESEQTITEIKNLSITIESEDVYSPTGLGNSFVTDENKIERTEASIEKALQNRKTKRTPESQRAKKGPTSKNKKKAETPRLNFNDPQKE